MFGVAFADDLPPEVLRVARTMTVNRDLLNKLSQYTCLETITRGTVEGRKRKLKQRDVVQLDVGVGADREIYSWPGASQFSSQDVGGLVGHGMVANGLFESFAASIFSAGQNSIVRAAGETIIHGRPAFHFTYRTSMLQQQWNINWLGKRGVVGYKGEFWVDESSFALVGLGITATNIPPSLPLQSLKISIDYQPLSQGSLIPASAVFTAVELNGKTNYDAFVFSHCHTFAAESRVADSSEDLRQAVQQYEGTREILPAGLSIPMTLTTPINATNARIGDLILASLDKDVRVSPQLTAPRGAVLKGRIREFDRVADAPNSFTVGLEFDELDWPGHAFSFFADVTSMEPVHGLAPVLFSGNTRTSNMLGGGVMTTGVTEMISASPIPGTATFFFQNASVLPEGFHMVWRTKKIAKD